MKIKLLKCGHQPNATKNGKPCCVICNCDEFAEETKKIPKERKARCPDCGKEVPSKPTLPFFKHRPDRDTDEFYCGCYGWD